MLRVQEDERRRIARELHDEAGQVLTAVKIELELGGRHEAGAMVGRALAQVRDLSNLLRPSALDDLGLAAALRALADDFSTRARIAVTLDLEGANRQLAPDVEVVIYRVVQEALTNVARHARASEVRVQLTGDERHISLVIEDNGQGAASNASPHMGWLGMRERITALGGQLSIGAGQTRGVRIEARHPHRRTSVSRSNAMRVLLADDHTLVRTGIRRILEGEPGIEVLAEAADGADRPRDGPDDGCGRAGARPEHALAWTASTSCAA